MTTKTFSPYACAAVVNIWLAEDGFQKKLPPQMFYTYTKKGYIKSGLDGKGRVQVSEQQLAEWYAKYTKKAAVPVIETATPEEDPNQLTLMDLSDLSDEDE
jgi:hypothetical protein